MLLKCHILLPNLAKKDVLLDGHNSCNYPPHAAQLTYNLGNYYADSSLVIDPSTELANAKYVKSPKEPRGVTPIDQVWTFSVDEPVYQTIPEDLSPSPTPQIGTRRALIAELIDGPAGFKGNEATVLLSTEGREAPFSPAI